MRASPTRPSMRRPPAGMSNISRTVSLRKCDRLDRAGEAEADMDDVAPGGSTKVGAAVVFLDQRERRRSARPWRHRRASQPAVDRRRVLAEAGAELERDRPAGTIMLAARFGIGSSGG